MKNGKEITSRTLTINYIISFIVWSFILSLFLEPIIEGLLEKLLESIFDNVIVTSLISDNYHNVSIAFIIGCSLFSIIIAIMINILTNFIAVVSSLSKLQSIDKDKANRYLKNVIIFLVILQILSIVLTFIQKQMTVVILINNIISFLISIFLIRKSIKKYIKKHINPNIDKCNYCVNCGAIVGGNFCSKCGHNQSK